MLKKFLVGTVVALALLVGTYASAADFGTTTLKVGSKGEAVKALQTLVGATVDGSFGPMTKAKVMVWQKANGLTADGLFGAKSKAVANGAVVGTLPAGCTSATGFSSTTGVACSTVTTLPAGCAAGALFSATTGASCTGAVSTGALTGGAGDINVTSTTTDVETTVAEGAANTKVLGFKVEASGSDVAVNNLKVTLKNIDAVSSYRLDKYATTVSIYENGTKVGSADVADFTKDGQQYSKSISLSNAVVRSGTSNKQTFYVEITAAPSIDTANMNTANWGIRVDNIRFQDATGVVMTSSDVVGSAVNSNGELTAGKFGFGTLGSTGDVKVTLSKSSASPVAQNVQVSDTGSTKDVLMLEFKVKAASSAISFDTITITPTAGVSTIGNIVGELQLRNGSSTLATIDGQSLTSGSTSAFNLDTTFTVEKDTTEVFRVYATINSQKNFTNGSTLVIALAHSGLSPEDANGDIVTGTNYAGSATGEVQTFFAKGINVTAFSVGTKTVSTATTSGATTSASYPITFKVTAFGNNYYILKTGLTAVTDSGATDSFSTLSATGATLDGNYWVVNDGDTATFTTTGAITSASAGFHKIGLNTLNYATDNGGAGATNYTFTPKSSYETDSTLF